MNRSTTPRKKRSPRARYRKHRSVLAVKRHHLLVRWSHWLNVPILLGLILSGTCIYWSSPIYQHKPDPLTENFDVAADIGIWICGHVPGLHHYKSPPDWIYNHMSLGPGMLALALRLHWLCAYAFMLNGAVYVAGMIAGGGWRGLLPRRSDLFEAFRMLRYSSAQHTSLFRSPAAFQSLQDGRFTSPCSSIGWLRSLVGSMRRAFGISGSCGSSSFSSCPI
jgi:hypothetical protein